MTDLEDAWSDLHAAQPPGWVPGRPPYVDERRVFEQYAYRSAERPRVGQRRDEWTAVGPSEAGCIREMARCLREIRAGRWPA